MSARLKESYRQQITPSLMKEFGFQNLYQVPRMLKVVVSMTTKDAVADSKVLNLIAEDLALITGQRPAQTVARRAISAFKLRKGMPIGLVVTLRGDRMYEFLDRLFNFAAAQIRDFSGFSTDSFDGRGGYSLGISEQLIFPEIDTAKVKKVFGMNITFHTTARHDHEARALLAGLGLPFRRK